MVQIQGVTPQKGYSSMFAYLREDLGYSEGAAQRRLQAMRLLKELPEIEPKLETGEISLSVASQAQSFFKKEEKKAPMKKEAKLELMNTLSGTSSRECERELIKLSPETALPREKIKPLTQEKTLIQLVASKELMNKLDRFQELTSHQNPEGKYDALISKALDIALEKLDPKLREERRIKRQEKKQKKDQAKAPKSQAITKLTSPPPSKSFIHSPSNRPPRASGLGLWVKRSPEAQAPNNQEPPEPKVDSRKPLPTSAVKTRHISNQLKDKIWLRDEAKCQFRDTKTGKTCGSRKYLELDHKFPFFLGGEHSEENLRLICKNHNLYRAKVLMGN